MFISSFSIAKLLCQQFLYTVHITRQRQIVHRPKALLYIFLIASMIKQKNPVTVIAQSHGIQGAKGAVKAPADVWNPHPFSHP